MIESYGGQQSEKIIRFFGHFLDGVSIWYMIYLTKFYRFLSSNVIILSFTAEFHSTLSNRRRVMVTGKLNTLEPC